MNEWIDFEHEVLYKNRYFSNHIIMEDIKKLSKVHYKMLPIDTLLCRSRIIEEEQIHKDAKEILGEKLTNNDVAVRVQLYDDFGIHGFNKQNSGMPPIEKTVDGRANPKFIPYLYLAIHPYTSVAECKPYQFDRVSVARYLLINPIKIMCLNNFFYKPSDELSFDEELLNFLSYKFGHPVKDNSKEYIVTQYIAEFIKHLGFDGISYMSSLHKRGENIVLFDEKKTKFIGSFVYKIKDIRFDIMPETINYNAPNIMPDENTL